MEDLILRTKKKEGKDAIDQEKKSKKPPTTLNALEKNNFFFYKFPPLKSGGERKADFSKLCRQKSAKLHGSILLTALSQSQAGCAIHI